MLIGVPVEYPSKIPERISSLSPSFRLVTAALSPDLLDCPGRRLSKAFCIFSSSILILLGVPSIITPRPTPWLSPKVVILKIFPNVFPDIFISPDFIVFLVI